MILPAPDAATALDVTDFNPDIENGSNTFLLGFGTPPAVGTDLDLGNDGTLDAPLTGFNVVDAVSIVESDGTANYAYADELGGYVFPQFANWTPDPDPVRAARIARIAPQTAWHQDSMRLAAGKAVVTLLA